MRDETFSAITHFITQLAMGLNGFDAEGVEETLSRLAEQDISLAAYQPPEPLLTVSAWTRDAAIGARLCALDS